MLNHKGTKAIKTERLLLRAIRARDYKDMYVYTVKEEVARYVTWSPHKSIKETKALCKMWAKECKRPDCYEWAIVLNGKVIGSIDVIKMMDTTAFLGWVLDSTYWGQGLMTEAAGAVLQYLFYAIGIDAAEAAYLEPNIGSGRVMQKIGMREVPYTESKHYQLKGETAADGYRLIFYKITKEEYASLSCKAE